MSPVKYELGFYIPEVGILHSHCRDLKSYGELGTCHIWTGRATDC
jgi:hypothetical protein